MSRLDAAIRKYPEFEGSIRLLAERAPGGNLKHLDWGARIIASGQALASEVADVIELFERFRGHRIPRSRHHVLFDINPYEPAQFTTLRDGLFSIKKKQDAKMRKREALYKLTSAAEAVVIWESPDLIVRHIKNKPASCHYGLGTKWCISMLREGYFDDYEAQNAIFFFIERKLRKNDPYDKVALMLPRGVSEDLTEEAFTSTDQRVNFFALARVFGPEMFDIYKEALRISNETPNSSIFQILGGTGTEAQIREAVSVIALPRARSPVAEAICCNDAAPWDVLETLWLAAKKKPLASAAGYRRRSRLFAKSQLTAIQAALYIHPNTPPEVKTKLASALTRSKVKLDSIERVYRDTRIEISYVGRRLTLVSYRRRSQTAKWYAKAAERNARRAERYTAKAAKLKIKEDAAKARRAAAKAKKLAAKTAKTAKTKR